MITQHTVTLAAAPRSYTSLLHLLVTSDCLYSLYRAIILRYRLYIYHFNTIYNCIIT